mmetsp:Transcript_9927/g.15256  ORF Transcript_9927/g.15256 Transcript_9927/m.15256 type:complete len:102 (-) Transcript_9927:60-365(-)
MLVMNVMLGFFKYSQAVNSCSQAVTGAAASCTDPCNAIVEFGKHLRKQGICMGCFHPGCDGCCILSVSTPLGSDKHFVTSWFTLQPSNPRSYIQTPLLVQR